MQPPSRKPSVGSYARVGVGLVLAVLVLNAVGTAVNLQTGAATNDRVYRTRTVIIALESALSMLKDAETGQRGYLLTGLDEYLAPYRDATAGIGPGLDRLAALGPDDDARSADLAELRRLAAERLGELAETVALQKDGRRDEALAVVLDGRGKATMDRIRAVGKVMIDKEYARLDVRLADVRRAIDRAGASFTVATTTALILLTAVASLKVREDDESARAAGAIAQERTWLSTTLLAIGDAVIATDADGRVKFMNGVAEGLTGWPEREAVGLPMDDVFRIVNETTGAPAVNPVGRVLREGVVVGLANHTALIARDGRSTPIEDSAAPIKDARGEVTGVVLVFHDVTASRAAETRLVRSEDRLRLAAAAADLGTWDYDPVRGAFARDARCERVFGLPPDAEATYDAFLAAVHPDDRSGVDAAVAGALDPAGGGALAHTFRVIGADDGAERVVGAQGRAYFEGGRAVRLVGAVLDVTARTRHDEELCAAKEQAEVANRAKDHFLAVLSHELRTPLNPILLAATAMLERPTPPEDVRPTLEMIRTNVNLQARLIDDLLDVMRIVRGKMPLHWEVVDCHRLLTQAIEISRSEALGKVLRVGTDFNAAHCHANVDPARLHQVFWNLIKNAFQFTPGGGMIMVRTYNERDAARHEERLVVEIVDTGIGIDADALPTVFEPFQQGEESITRRYGGMGLGLAICRGIVEAHGGALAASSGGVDQGSTFRVALKALTSPAKIEAEGGAPAAAADADGRAAALSILTVEDDPTTLRLMARLLRGLGHEVATANTVATAVEAVGSRDFDLIISDIGLPDGSGLDLMRRVVARGKPVRGVALTGYGMEEDILRSRAAGFTAHMTKPIDFSKLEAMIRQITA